jgi:hypothetical protein
MTTGMLTLPQEVLEVVVHCLSEVPVLQLLVERRQLLVGGLDLSLAVCSSR